MKRGKEDSRYHPRKFVLCEAEDTLKYHVKENKVIPVIDSSGSCESREWERFNYIGKCDPLLQGTQSCP